MDTSAISAVTATSTVDDRSTTGIADDFESFLMLLVTQLENQDPTSPMEAEQFTQQLVQFSGVEQQIKSNDTLAELASLMKADQLSNAASYLGAEVEANGDVFRLGEDGAAKLHYDLERPASSVTLMITDEFGRVVALKPGDTETGRHSLTWDGLGDDGVQRTEGSFKVEVLAQDSAGAAVPSSTMVGGIVDGVELSGAETLLSVDGVLMSLQQISAIRTPSSNS